MLATICLMSKCCQVGTRTSFVTFQSSIIFLAGKNNIHPEWHFHSLKFKNNICCKIDGRSFDEWSAWSLWEKELSQRCYNALDSSYFLSFASCNILTLMFCFITFPLDLFHTWSFILTPFYVKIGFLCKAYLLLQSPGANWLITLIGSYSDPKYLLYKGLSFFQ